MITLTRKLDKLLRKKGRNTKGVESLILKKDRMGREDLDIVEAQNMTDEEIMGTDDYKLFKNLVDDAEQAGFIYGIYLGIGITLLVFVFGYGIGVLIELMSQLWIA